MALLTEASWEKDEKFNLIQRCNLTEYLWSEVKRRYGYAPEKPGLTDFAFELFSSDFAAQTGGEPSLSLQGGCFYATGRTAKHIVPAISGTLLSVRWN